MAIRAATAWALACTVAALGGGCTSKRRGAGPPRGTVSASPAGPALTRVEAGTDRLLEGGAAMPVAAVPLAGDDALLLWWLQDGALAASRPGQPAFEVLPALGTIPGEFSLREDHMHWTWSWDGDQLQVGNGLGFWARVAPEGVRARGRLPQTGGQDRLDHSKVAALGHVGGQTLRLAGRDSERWLERWHDGAWQRWLAVPARPEVNVFQAAFVQDQERVGLFEVSGASWRVYLVGPDQKITTRTFDSFVPAAATCAVDGTSLLALSWNGLATARVADLGSADPFQHLADDRTVDPDLVRLSCADRQALLAFGRAEGGPVHLAPSSDGGRSFQRLQGGAQCRGPFALVGDPMQVRLYYARGEARELVRRTGSFGKHGFHLDDEVRLGSPAGTLTAAVPGTAADLLVLQDELGVPTLYRAAR